MSKEFEKTVEEAMEPAMDIVEATAEKSGMGAAAVVAIGTGVVAVTALVVTGISFGVKALKERKSKKELHKPEGIVEVTDEQVEEVVK